MNKCEVLKAKWGMKGNSREARIKRKNDERRNDK